MRSTKGLAGAAAAVLLSALALDAPVLRADAVNTKPAATKTKTTANANTAPNTNTKAGAVSSPETGDKAKIRDNSYYYSAFNRRDPFASLIVGEFVSEKKMEPVDMNQVALVGVITGDLDRFALLEDTRGFSYILRVGDRVRNGSVVAIGDESIVAQVTSFGQTQNLALHLAKRDKGDEQ